MSFRLIPREPSILDDIDSLKQRDSISSQNIALFQLFFIFFVCLEIGFFFPCLFFFNINFLKRITGKIIEARK